MAEKGPLIIAMQGDPYTGKTFLANELAVRLKVPTIRLDDILSLIGPSEPCPQQQDALKSFGFEIIGQIVRTQVSLGLSVIIDSPLSRLSHLHSLVALVNTLNPTARSRNARILILECRPNNEYAWEMRFEDEIDSCGYRDKWYKPSPLWPLNSTPEFTRDYTDDDMPPNVSKLVVNTTDFYSPCHMLLAMYDLTSCGNRHIAEYNSHWRFIHEDNPNDYECLCCPGRTKPLNSSKTEHIHMVNVFKQEGIDYDATCGVCETQISKLSGGCYTCQGCPLTVHKSCAELDQDSKKYCYEPESFPKLLQMEPNVAYKFPVERACSMCLEDGKEFSGECRSCVFESHLKSRLLPTIVHHVGHEHSLSFAAKSVLGNDPYICVACKKYGVFVAYFCKDCTNTAYHPECVLLPTSVEHTHGGHEHELEMVFHRDTKMEDYMCDLCHTKMDPKAWYYHCSKCIVYLHLGCAFLDFDY